MLFLRMMQLPFLRCRWLILWVFDLFPRWTQLLKVTALVWTKLCLKLSRTMLVVRGVAVLMGMA